METRRFPRGATGCPPLRAAAAAAAGPVPLPPVLEPVADLRWRQAGGRRQLPLLPGGRVRFVMVPLSEYIPRFFLFEIK